MKRLARRALVALGALSSLLSSVLPSAATEELDLFAWSEYVPQSVLDGFTKQTGIRVVYESYGSNEELLAKLVSARRATT
jgi:spermidine/putrescine transport system substrate-binding protein